MQSIRNANLEGAWGRQSGTPAVANSGSGFSPAATPPELLDMHQAAKLLGISVRKFNELRAADFMPHAIELGPRSLRWVRSELLTAMSSQAPRCKGLTQAPGLRNKARSRKVPA